MNINIENYLRLNFTDMILILISTLLICLLAKKYFWNYALQYLDARHKLIQDELNQASASKQEGETYKKQYADQLKNAKNEAHEIKEKAREEAKHEGSLILEKANHDAKLALEKATRDIELEKINAQKQIKQEITEVAFTTAQKILEKEIDEETQKNYVNQFINEDE